MQIKTTIRDHFTPIRITIIKKEKKTKMEPNQAENNKYR